MTLDVEQGVVCWKVNGVVEARHKAKNMKDAGIEWVPYWMVLHEGFAIEYLD